MIRLERVSKVYSGASRVQALLEVSIEIGQGEWISIIGPSGAGKTTLLSILGLLDTPTTGTYQLDDRDIGTLGSNHLADLRARLFGFVFQTFHLIPGRSVVENVELGMLYANVPRNERNIRAIQAIADVRLEERAEAEVSTLSGGEKQRAVIARALASNARILLCDEPTGNLDRETGGPVFDGIKRLHQSGTTVVVVTHDHNIAQLGGRTVSVLNGRLST